MVAIPAGRSYFGDMSLPAGRLIEAVVMHVPLVPGPHMLQETVKELRDRECKSFLQAIPIVLVLNSDVPAVIAGDPFLRQRRSPRIAATVGGSFPATFILAHHVDNEARSEERRVGKECRL